jgi:hypothetical protein
LERFKRIISTKVSTPIRFEPFVPPWRVPDILSELDYVLLPYDKAIPSESNLLKEAVSMGKDIMVLKDGVFSIVEHKQHQNYPEYKSAGYNGYNDWINENICAIKSCAAQ